MILQTVFWDVVQRFLAFRKEHPPPPSQEVTGYCSVILRVCVLQCHVAAGEDMAALPVSWDPVDFALEIARWKRLINGETPLLIGPGFCGQSKKLRAWSGT